MSDKNDDPNSPQNEERRSKTMTEKGKEYQMYLLDKERSTSQRSWRKQIRQIENLLVDSDDIEKLRNERSNLETRLEIMSSAFEAFERSLENLEERRATSEKFELLEQEHSEVLKRITQRISELRQLLDSSSVTSRSSRRSKGSGSSKKSTKSVVTKQNEVASRVASLETELKLADIDTQREAALIKHEGELKRFQITKTLEIAKAEMDALYKIEEEEEVNLPAENCSEDRLQEYVTSQMNFVMSYNHDTPVTQPEVTMKREPASLTNLNTKIKTEPDVKRYYSPLNPFAPPLFSAQSTPIYTSTSHTVPNIFGAPLTRTPPPEFYKQGSAANNNSSSSSTTEESLAKLADLLSDRRKQDSLPLPEPEKFEGDLMHYPVWLKSFETIIESQTQKPSQRLYYLGKYTAGDAKKAISGLLQLDSQEAYEEAKKTLQDRFGNPFLVADAHRRKINDWPKIPPNDGVSLRKFSDFLLHCQASMSKIKYLRALNDPEENLKMASKLPKHLFDRWGREVDRWMSEETTINAEDIAYPPFSQFCKFLAKEARIACNPVISSRVLDGNNKDNGFKLPRSSGTFKPRASNANCFATGSNEITNNTEDAKNANRKDYNERKRVQCAKNHTI